MFLKDLYNYSKPAFYGFIGFLMAFIFLNYKWGMVAAPVFQFGMYSKPVSIKDTQTVYKVYLNEKPADLSKFGFTERDILLVSLENYQKSFPINESVYLTMNRILSAAGANGLMKREVYVKDANYTEFNYWYKKLLQEIAGYPVNSAVVTRSVYVSDSAGFKQISLPENIFPFGTQ